MLTPSGDVTVATVWALLVDGSLGVKTLVRIDKPIVLEGDDKIVNHVLFRFLVRLKAYLPKDSVLDILGIGGRTHIKIRIYILYLLQDAPDMIALLHELRGLGFLLIESVTLKCQEGVLIVTGDLHRLVGEEIISEMTVPTGHHLRFAAGET